MPKRKKKKAISPHWWADKLLEDLKHLEAPSVEEAIARNRRREEQRKEENNKGGAG